MAALKAEVDGLVWRLVREVHPGAGDDPGLFFERLALIDTRVPPSKLIPDWFAEDVPLGKLLAYRDEALSLLSDCEFFRNEALVEATTDG